MQDKVLSLLGIAAKAGKAASGGFSAEEAVRSHKAKLVVIAGDALTNTTKRFADKCGHYRVPYRFYGSKEAIGHALGKQPRACVAVLDRGLADSILKLLPGDGGSGEGDSS